jgi:2,4-dienoyl-CoA reductase-like NADH-dependent reductase (Old Yellow Enzyme family)
LLDQFFWHETNTRDDAYGGSAAARGQFVAEVVSGIKARTGADFPVILRISQWKIQDYGAQNWPSPEELDAFLAPLVAAGVDVFHCSQRRYWEPAFAGSPLNLAGWVKRITGRPVITVGSITLSTEFIATLMEGETATPRGLDDLVERVRGGEFDLVVIGRPLITNPDWPQLVASGRMDELRPFAAGALATIV